MENLGKLDSDEIFSVSPDLKYKRSLFSELCAINKIHFDETELMGTVEMIAFAALIKVNRVPVVSDIN